MAIAAIACFATVANAQTKQWNFDPSSSYNSGGGTIKSAVSTFNQVTKRFTFSADFGNVPGTNHKTDGFWLVVSPGANPKGHAGELSIFYFDASKSTGPVLTTYTYNGVNGSNSYKNGNGLGSAPDTIASSIASQSWINNMTKQDMGGTRRLSFDIDAAVIQNHTPKYPGPGGAGDWTGAAFGNEIGVWFHPVSGLSTQYNQKGYLTNFNYCSQGWFDANNQKTTPEPASMVVLGAAIAALAKKRKATRA